MSPKETYWGDVALPGRFNLCEYFLDHNLAAGRGAKTALVCGERRRTYAELSTRARQAAAALRRRGVRPEERVLFVLPDGFEFAEAWFGTLRAGALFAMVNPLLKAEQFAYYLEYSKARAAFVHAEALGEFAQAARGARFLETTFVVGGEPALAGPTGVDYERALEAEDPQSAGALLEPTGPDDLAGWLFTSGSTGHPKACVHTHGDFAYSTETYALRVAGYRENDVCLSVPKLFFGYATGTNLMFPFRVGATVALFPGRATADELFDQIARHRPTFLTSVPTMINNMLRSPRCDSADLSSLRVALSAGEALPAQLYEEWKARTAVEILDGIGSAEMFHIYCSNRPGDVRPGSLGRVVDGYTLKILPSEATEPGGPEVPVGETGVMWVRGDSASMGYFQDRTKSFATFLGPWCRTGDLFRLDEAGYLYFTGRADDLLKVSGVWVAPLEVEECLHSHPAVSLAAVIGAEEEGLTKVKAFIVLRDEVKAKPEGHEALALELKEHVKERLSKHKYPRWIAFVDDVPKNDRGKVDKKTLKEREARGENPKGL